MTTVLPPAVLEVERERGIYGNTRIARDVSEFDHNPAEALIPQIPPQVSEKTSERERQGWLTVSPYLEPEHQLDLESINTPNQLLALALTHLQAVTPDYATVDYNAAFNWEAVMSQLKVLSVAKGYRWKRQSFYVVEFRSKLKQDIDVDLLFRLDKESHAEATASGGLLKYWYGVADSERRNLATCLWRSKEDAVNGGRGPWHKQARAAIAQMYEMIDVHGLRLTIEDDVEDWSFGPYH
ncbi:hypothetical protein HRR83_001230 [Exophiala dermatitidis]|uniref:Uncharacterized protein n=2 Tax=Exophiala dermatitidis TaxID=5970 RepID=H6C6Z8_EXODN|nr:uncharacterized protein HMPREF1120_07482 [Exophiala dermatitidis NIH/UT8656]KAJ4522738.1 hypothetical protein HRR75_001132 [Exophiala dermatitidis]EHY59494.1 hypothetical protein HMPREF1120_07482 [Exophiala dermatitidis NIH/UT8656]KAJ4526041.1 hypothetical protein HRR74_001234 [Exophiala dermatitidis]KAJ4527013.1 hypothetical protein HRR73_001810 [Exophiala dermatitidis]KAJ4546758.1 hypothetical protein HRR77_004302 [Exophiala dermatitidis]